MTTDDWARIEAAFAKALALAGSERDAFIEQFAEDHPALADRLKGLIAADAGSDEKLQAPIAAKVQALAEGTRDPWIGRQLGAWTTTERIASGGMGAVFVAERSDGQFRQKAAVKILSAQLLSPETIARFKAERQILAGLNHPYIAQLHDGGTTDDGVPYLVMEYVEGLPIDMHCDEKQLGIDERLALFRKVCDAVDYAHRRLTVHRDLKPNNILVDQNGNPKLLDFGIAKLLDERAINMTVAVTRDGARAMTPEYASPEQVRGEQVSVATDVYSLGVLLFRLMTGQSPYGLTDATPHDYERAIIGTDPKRPSTIVTGAGDAAEISQRRGLTDKQLRGRLAGDLDNIVLKALQKEPERRYLAASALATDIGRYLRHQPVEARGDDWTYIAKKFAVRNARALAVTIAVVAGIAVLVTFYTLQLAEERDRANFAASQAREVSSFLASVFDSASPLVQQGDDVTALDLLQQGVERIEALDEQPALQAELFRIMGSSYTQLGEYERGRELLEQSFAYRDGNDSVSPVELAETLVALAEAQRLARDYDTAIATMRRAVGLRQSIHGGDHPDLAFTIGKLGTALGAANYTEEALETLQQALAMKRRIGGDPDIVLSDLLGNISVRLDTLGRYDEAEAVGREAIAMSETVNGPNHPYTLIRMSNMALVLARRNEFQPSADLLHEMIRRAQQTWPEGHPRLSFATQAYGQVLQRLGRFDDALVQLEAARDIALRGPGEDSLDYVGTLYGIALWYLDTGQTGEAAALLDEAMAKARAIQGDDGYFVLLLHTAFSSVYAQQEDWDAVERHASNLIDNAARLGADQVNRAHGYLALAYAYSDRITEGEQLMHGVLEATAVNEEAAQISVLRTATRFYRAAGNLEESIAIGERLHDIVGRRLPPTNWLAAWASSEYARSLHAAGKVEEARPVLRAVIADLEAVLGSEHERVVKLAALLDDEGANP